ncbi:MAG: hypothetical protein ASARMPRED_004329 [Alectoria sarmentosa]|nr:MAG: hypothetical protein ASARMPRED_004329 [Alectoria sarmentosa]
MSDLIREAPIGQLLRFVTRRKVFRYPEELPGFQLPETYSSKLYPSSEKSGPSPSESVTYAPSPQSGTFPPSPSDSGIFPPSRSGPNTNPPSRSGSETYILETFAPSRFDSEQDASSIREADAFPELQHHVTNRNIESGDIEEPAALPPARIRERTYSGKRESTYSRKRESTYSRKRESTYSYTAERLQAEAEQRRERPMSLVIVPQKTPDGHILVDWYSTDDAANPQNWSNGKRGFIAMLICAYTFAVYCGSAIYSSGEFGVIKRFGVSPTDASLPLSLYVLAYGMGPLLWAPLSEIPIVGRSPIYAVTMVIFVILSVPTALVNNFAGLLVLRFLQGFFGSPCLATGGATMQDMYSLLKLPYALTFWVSAAYCGPSLGPLLSGFAVMAKGWRWSLWEIIWIAGPVLVLMLLFIPETSTPNILLRRAQRLRALTGDIRLRSQSEIDQKNIKPSKAIVSAIIKPLEITIKDPAIAFVNFYTALVYGIYYSFFEAFPLVYPVFYHFTLGTVGVVFTCILVACGIGVLAYVLYLYFYLVPDIMAHGLRAQEHRLVPALIASFFPPAGLFIFAWTARPDIPWIASVIGIVVFAIAVFVILQCIFVYVPLSYPQYAASLFASNDFFRSAMACGCILFSRPLFLNLGIDKGVTTLAGLSIMGIIGMFTLYFNGAKMRSRSKFAMS